MSIFNATIVFFIIISLAGMSGLFAERSGTINIGINGMMLAGAVVYFFTARVLNGNGGYQILNYMIATVAGGATAILFGFASITLRSNQIVSGTAINLLVSAIGLFLLVKAASDPATQSLQDSAWALSPDRSKIANVVSLILFLGIVVLIICAVVLKYTSWGLRLKAAGENPQSLDSQGISVLKMRYHGIIISGLLAGLAGAMFMQYQGTYTGNVQGLGFIGLAVLISGQWRTSFVMISAVIFASIYSVAQNIVAIQASLSEIQPLIQTIPFVLSLIALVVFSKRSKAPASAGMSYDKSKR